MSGATRRLARVVAAGIAVACSIGLLPSLASAQARHARTFIAWDDALVGAGCSTGDAIRAAVEARLGRPLGARSREDGELILEARRVEGASLVAELTLLRAGGDVLGVRRIETSEARCDTLDAGLPLVIAMLVDLHEHDAVVTLPAVSLPAVPVAALVPEVVASPQTPPSAEAWGSLEAGLSLDVGGLPAPGFALEIVSELGERGPLSGMIRAAFLSPQTTRAVGSVEVWGARAALGGCLRAEPTGFALGGCVLVEGGVLHVAGQGFDVSRAGEAPHAGAVALLEGVLLSLSPFTVRVEVGATVPFVVQRFVYDEPGGEEALFVASPVTLRAGLFLGLRAW